LFFKRGDLELSLINWRLYHYVLQFKSICSFSYYISELGFKGLPEAQFIEIPNSEEIREIEKSELSARKNGLRHYVISTNEDEWCEIFAEGYVLHMNTEN
jgi:hypothetical protein